MDRHVSHQSNKPTDSTSSDGSDLREKRERLVKLLGRLLARHWLRRQTGSEGYSSSTTGNQTVEKPIVPL
jgi:hypothetical protein